MTGNFAALVRIMTAGGALEEAADPTVSPTPVQVASMLGVAAANVQQAANYWGQEGFPAQQARAQAVADTLGGWTANPPPASTIFAYQNAQMDLIYRDAARSANGTPWWVWASIALSVVGAVATGYALYDAGVLR